MAHKIERAVLAQRIRELDGLTNDERSALLELLNTKKFGLVWENKLEDVEERLRESLPVLKEVKEKALTQGGADAPNHIIIEGDNLEALTALTYTHEGKIDVIYIDPPYNTGNKDFVYNDNYVDAEDGYRHSKWLSFMSRRLKIAKRLLSDKGVIFISIDDNEQANIKLLCDEVFGIYNFIAQMIWQQGKKHIGSFVGVNHEYMLVYAKSKEIINDNQNKWKQRKEGLDKIYAVYDRLKQNYGDDYESIEREIKDWFATLPENDPAYGSKHYNRIDFRGLFFAADISQGTGNGPRYDVLHPVTHKPVAKPAGGWRYAFETMQMLLKEERIYFGDDETTVPCRKRYLKETEYELPSSVFYRDGRGASKELETILGSKKFNNPKDRNEIARILNFRENSTILDFFAGSGTTLHATMQLNEEDKGHRQCILVTNNENNICEEVTYERNKRVINGYTTSKGVAVEGLHGNNLRYYKVGFVPRENTLSAKRQLMAASTDLLCIKNGIYTEQSQFGTLALKPNIARYFEENGKRMLVIFREEAIEKLVAEIKRMTLDEPIITYVFSSNNYAMDADFEEVADKVSLCALPAAIYNAYLKVLPKRKAKNPENEDAGESDESMEEQQKLDFGEEETL